MTFSLGISTNRKIRLAPLWTAYIWTIIPNGQSQKNGKWLKRFLAPWTSFTSLFSPVVTNLISSSQPQIGRGFIQQQLAVKLYVCKRCQRSINQHKFAWRTTQDTDGAFKRLQICREIMLEKKRCSTETIKATKIRQ